MKRMMSKREIEIAERIDELTVELQHAQEGLARCEADLLRYRADYEDSGDEGLLPYIQSASLDIGQLEVYALALQLEIEELEEEAKTA